MAASRPKKKPPTTSSDQGGPANAGRAGPTWQAPAPGRSRPAGPAPTARTFGNFMDDTPDRDPLRARVAAQAARLMHELGITDPLQAGRKAARQLGADSASALPDAEQILQALAAHRRLFARPLPPPEHARILRQALEAMTHLARFRPRLVGSLLDGVADPQVPVTLHLSSADPEAVGHWLTDQHIPWRLEDRRFRLDRKRSLTVPTLQVHIDDQDFALVVFPLDGPRQAPLDPATGRPMARAGLARVRELLAAVEPAAG